MPRSFRHKDGSGHGHGCVTVDRWNQTANDADISVVSTRHSESAAVSSRLTDDVYTPCTGCRPTEVVGLQFNS